MDERTLAEATERWIEAGLIDEETANAIRAHEAERDADSSGDFTTILAAMGASLVGVGVLIFLGANWQELPVSLRTAILLVIPLGFAAGGYALDRRALPRAGVGMWSLGAVAVGPSLYLLGDLHAPGIEPTWPLLLWGMIAVPMGHAFRTRLATGIGLVALLGAIFASGEGHTGFVLIGLLATLIVAAALPVRERSPELVDTYRVIGVAAVLFVFLWANTIEGNFENVQIEMDAGLAGSLVLAVGVAVLAVALWQQSRVERGDALLVTIPPIALLLLLGILGTFEPLPAMVGYFAVQFLLLLVLVSVVIVALVLGSWLLVNLVFVGFFVQILTLLVTVTGHLSGAAALIVIGLVLIVSAVGLERGRRHVVERLEDAG